MTPEQVARESSVSRRLLEVRFRAAVGRTLGAEIRRTRLGRARHLLGTTTQSIDAVARLSGFSHGRHLAVVFGAEFGETPTAYRARVRG